MDDERQESSPLDEGSEMIAHSAQAAYFRKSSTGGEYRGCSKTEESIYTARRRGGSNCRNRWPDMV